MNKLILIKIIRSGYILLLIMLFSCNQIEEKPFILLSKIDNTNYKICNKILLCNSENNIYYLSKSTFNNMNLHCLGVEDKIKIDSKGIINNSIESFDVYNSMILVNCHKKTFIFKLINNYYSMVDSISHNYLNAKFYNNTKIWFWRNYNFGDLSKADKTKIGIYNLNKNKFDKELNINFQYIQFTHLINLFIDVSPNRKHLAISQVAPYEVNIYDSSLSVTDKIKDIQLDHFIDQIDSAIESFEEMYYNTSSIKSSIAELKIEDQKIDRIQKIYYLNDSTILIVKKIGSQNLLPEERVLDIWTKKSNRWTSKIQNKVYFASPLKIDEPNISFQIPFSQSDPIIIHNNKAYVVMEYFPNNKLNKMDDFYNYFESLNPENITYGIFQFNIN